MRKYCFVFIFLYPLIAFTQQSKIDSLQNLLISDKEDSNKVNHLNLISVCYWYTSPDTAFHLSENALALSEKIGFEKGVPASLNNMGVVNYLQGNFKEAMNYFLKTINAYERAKNKTGIAATYNNIGLVQYEQHNYAKAIEYYTVGLKVYEELNDKTKIGGVYNNIASSYYYLNDFKKSIEYQEKSLDMAKQMGNKKAVATSLGNIGIIYDELSDFNKAVDYYSKALNILKELQDKNGLAATYGNIGVTYSKLGEYQKAIDCIYKGLLIAEEIDSKDIMQNNCEAMAETYASMKNFKDAYEYHKKYSDIKDSLLNEESTRQITEMQTKYETEKKEQQITLLNKEGELQKSEVRKQKIIIWSVVSGLLIVVLLSLFIIKERRKSEKLLLNILPAETARELKAKGKASAKHYESVTVMFTDFKGFTTIAEKLSAEELVSELDFLFRKFDEIISKYPIEKIKTIGDAYMCAGGLPAANTTHGEDVVSAAIEIQSWMTAQNNKWNLRIGIHTGAVTAGVVGDKKFAYDIWGDTVNIASRMESSGEPNKINISGNTYQFVKDKFTCQFRGKISAKNKGEIEMYFLEKHNS
ncbi:MAG: tetratricopeptide repeat protein [Bacteroidetes bacterium]|nr:tetratricopeptide repeat protein [Bacteroidota bacterium]